FTEYVDGMSLEALITHHGPLPEPMVAHIVYSVAQALSYLHDDDICHRDVSPANVLISNHGRVKLSDFGLARTTDDEYSCHGFKGRIAFACPARLHTDSYSSHSDLWALLVTAYYAASGYVPFGPDDPTTPGQAQFEEVFTRIIAHEFAKPATPFSWFLNEMFGDLRIQSAHGRRFQSADDLAEFVKTSFAVKSKLAGLGDLVRSSAQGGGPAWERLPPVRQCELANTQLELHRPGTNEHVARRRLSKAARPIVLAILCFLVSVLIDNGSDPTPSTVQPPQDQAVEVTSHVNTVCYSADDNTFDEETDKEPRVHAENRKRPAQLARKVEGQQRRGSAKGQKAKSSVVVLRGRTIPIPSRGDNP
ncbi:MAG: protein kinase, partial [Proteobacteria bacterium]|nr:protein kinase [Pseudomonadota bacterium]